MVESQLLKKLNSLITLILVFKESSKKLNKNNASIKFLLMIFSTLDLYSKLYLKKLKIGNKYNSIRITCSIFIGLNNLTNYLSSLNLKSNLHKAELFRKLSNLFYSIGDFKNCELFYEIYLSFNTPFLNISKIENIKKAKIYSREINKISDKLNEIGFDFISSNCEREQDHNESFRNLFYLHIPRSGGNSFERPFHYLKEEILYKNKRILNSFANEKKNSSNHLILTKIINEPEINKFRQLLKTNQNNYSSILVSPHCKQWHELYRELSIFEDKLNIFCTIRDPNERLKSHIKDLLSRDTSLKILFKKINSENCELDNAIFNFIHGNIDSQKNPFENINFISLKDNQFINKIKSNFISISRFPNIVQIKRFNRSKFKNIKNINSQTINEIFDICVKKGFLEKDQSINFDDLFLKTKYKFKNLKNQNTEYVIHPFTFIIRGVNDYVLLPTDYFVDNYQKVLFK